MAKMKVMTPRQTLRIIFLPLVPPLPRPALPVLASDVLLEDRGKEELPACSCGRNAPPDGSMAQERAGSNHHTPPAASIRFASLLPPSDSWGWAELSSPIWS